VQERMAAAARVRMLERSLPGQSDKGAMAAIVKDIQVLGKVLEFS
jgi:hypothetical protein